MNWKSLPVIVAAGTLLSAAIVCAAPPALLSLNMGVTTLGNDGKTVVGGCFLYNSDSYDVFRYTRGSTPSLLLNMGAGIGLPLANGADATVLAGDVYETNIPGANYENISCFNGYDFGWTDTNGVCTPTNPSTYGTPRPDQCEPRSLAHRWTAGSGWIDLGSLPRYLDPVTGRYYGGTSCDAPINYTGQITGDGRYVTAAAWRTELSRTNPCGAPGVSFGLCGDFVPMIYDSLPGTWTVLPTTGTPGNTTARIDSVNGNGTVACGYDAGDSPDPDGGLTATMTYTTIPISSSVQLQPGQNYWVGFQVIGTAQSTIFWGTSSSGQSVNLAQALTAGANTSWQSTTNPSPPQSSVTLNAPAIRLTGNDGACGLTLIDTFDAGNSYGTTNQWFNTPSFNRAMRFTVPGSTPVTLCNANIPLAANSAQAVILSIWADDGSGITPANVAPIATTAISGPLTNFSGWRAAAWRNNGGTWTETLLDPYGYPNPGMVCNTGGGLPISPGNPTIRETYIALGMSNQGAITTFNPPAQWSNPPVSGACLVRFVFSTAQNKWVPTNLGRPIPKVIGGISYPAAGLTPSAMSADGNVIVGTVEYGDVGIAAQAVAGFIWSPTINGGVPLDFNTYFASIDTGPAPISANGVSVGTPLQISADGNAMLVSIGDNRNYCGTPADPTQPYAVSYSSSPYGILYLNGAGVACEAPQMIEPLESISHIQTIATRLGWPVNAFVLGSWPLNYQWQRENSPNSNTWTNLTDGCELVYNPDPSSPYYSETNTWEFEGAHSPQLRIGLFKNVENHTARYRVIVSNSCGSTTSTPAQIQIDVGACCFFATNHGCAQCVLSTPDACGGTYAEGSWNLGGTFGGIGSVCSPDTCPDLAVSGACCVNASNACFNTCDFDCTYVYGGDFGGTGTACTPSGQCSPTTGACCDGLGGCAPQTAANCTAPAGAFQGVGSSCGPTNCGVCCRGSTCVTSVFAAAACQSSLPSGSGAGFKYVANAACGGANHKTPCCYADYNQNGAKTVADIFAYLTDWFAHSPYAFNGTPGAGNPPVSQIFAFLSDWFAGC